MVGEQHWPTPTNQYHMTRDEWKAKTVRNRLWRTINFKAAVVLDATPTLHAEPMSVDADTEVLELSEQIMNHELKRGNWQRIRRDIFLDGAVNGKGIAHVYTWKDPLSGEVRVCAEKCDLKRFSVDPSATTLTDARYITYKPSMDVSRLAQIFDAETAKKVKASSGPAVGTMPSGESSLTRSENEMIFGPSGDVVIGKDGVIRERKADVAFIWIKDYESLKIEIEQITMPDGSFAQGKETKSRAYPYGRLIVISGDTLLYDDVSPYELESVFPFAEYTHYRNTERFWSYGDTAHLKSNQMVADKTMAIALDGARKVIFGNLEVPIGADGYSNKGNTPDEVVAVPPELSGMAHYVRPENVNLAFLQFIDETNYRDFERDSGVSDVSAGTSPNAPTSGIEVQARQRAAATIIGQHLKEMNQFSSDFANIWFQIARQNYTGERNFGVTGPTSELQAISADMSLIPAGVVIRVEADPDEIERDHLEGQNIQALVASKLLFDPMMVPFWHVLLPSYGIRPQKAREIQKILGGMMPELMAQQQQQKPPDPPSADKILVAMSDILKVQPMFVSYEQVQQALQESGINPAPAGHAEAASVHQLQGAANSLEPKNPTNEQGGK